MASLNDPPGGSTLPAIGALPRQARHVGAEVRRRVRRASPGVSRCHVCFLCACLLVVAPRTAEAFDLSGGVSVGGILAGAKPRLAVSPHVAITWITERGILFAAQETPSILPAINDHGPGIYNQITAVVGYGWKDYNVSAGPALSIYSMPACNGTTCRRVVGLSLGGHAQLDAYLTGPLGISVSVNVDWIGGNSIVLPGSVAVTAVAGPIVRLGVR